MLIVSQTLFEAGILILFLLRVCYFELELNIIEAKANLHLLPLLLVHTLYMYIDVDHF